MKGATRGLNGGKLSEVNARTVSRRQNELVGKFKMAVGDLVSIRGQVMEYTYIPTGIKGEMVRSGVAPFVNSLVTPSFSCVHKHLLSCNPLVASFVISLVMPSLSCVHKHLLSFD